MFSISFTDELLEYPYDDVAIPAAPGCLILGECREDFLANLSKWSKADYEQHWYRELRSLIKGHSKIALIVSYNDPQAASNLEIWRIYREDELVYFQNQLPWYDSLPPDFDPLKMSGYISDRIVTTPEGNRISEWVVGLQEVQSFLHDSGIVEAD